MNTTDALVERNMRNVQRIISGDFESVMEDLIQQLEATEIDSESDLPGPLKSHRIAETLCRGVAGLHPNGFEFSQWLWDVAPLHVVRIPSTRPGAETFGYRYGVTQVRKIAAMVGGVYLRYQPKRLVAVCQMLDCSLDLIDARNVIIHALQPYYDTHFEQETDNLERMARKEKGWRRFIPLAVCGRTLHEHPDSTTQCLQIVLPLLSTAPDEHVLVGLRYVMRTLVSRGDSEALFRFLEERGRHLHPESRKLLVEYLLSAPTSRSLPYRDSILDLLDHRTNGTPKAASPYPIHTKKETAG